MTSDKAFRRNKQQSSQECNKTVIILQHPLTPEQNYIIFTPPVIYHVMTQYCTICTSG